MDPIISAGLAIGLGLVFFWLLVARPAQKINRRRAQSKPLESVDQPHCQISRRALGRLTYRFIEGEDSVLWANRQHPIVFWEVGGLLIAGAIIGLALGVGLLIHPLSLHYTEVMDNRRTRHTSSFSWLGWLCLLGAGACAVLAWDRWLRWLAVYRLVTNRHFITINQPWAWAFWLWQDGEYDPQPLTKIVSVAPDDEAAGRIFNYGTVRVKVPSMEAPDAGLDIHHQPDYEEFATRLDNLRAEAQEESVEPARKEASF